MKVIYNGSADTKDDNVPSVAGNSDKECETNKYTYKAYDLRRHKYNLFSLFLIMFSPPPEPIPPENPGRSGTVYKFFISWR